MENVSKETPNLTRKFGSTSTVGNDPQSLSVDLDIEELDDKEYDLPPVGTPPTLESILNEPDDLSLSEEDLQDIQPPFDFFQDSGETTSVGSSESFGRRSDNRSGRRSPVGSFSGASATTHGSLLRHVILRGVSSQLQSAADRVQAGKPTSMAVSSLIAIGTSKGMVLVFDAEQVLKWCLGGREYGESYGAVSAITFNGDSSRLLCGYARGQLTMWDVNNGKLLRLILDAHPPETTILHVKFTDDPALALCSDSGGSVFELNFRRVMGTRTCESRCIFSGSRGEVCTLEPLRMSPHFREHSSQDVCLLALGTVTKVIVVTVRPFLRVWFTHQLKADKDTLPLLCWQFVVIQVSSSTRVIDPVLAFGRQNTIYFYQVTFATAEKITFIPLQKMRVNHLVQNFAWLNTRTIVTLDTSEHLHVIDVKSDEELEVFEAGDAQLVYGTSHFKGLATGGNVSKAMAAAGERACYYSVASFGSQLLLLGVKSVHVLTLRTWIERLDLLAKQKMYPEALSLALSFYEDNAKAVTGISGKRPQRQQLVSAKMSELLEAYVDVIMTRLCPERGRVEHLISHYRETVPRVVHFCLAIRKRDFLFGKAYEKLSSDPLAKAVYLESLESHILDDKLPALTPPIAQAFVQHYSQYPNKFDALEACLVRLDVACLDLHQVLTLCRQHGLYDAFLYVHNRAMLDYVSPMEDLFEILREEVEKGKQLTDDRVKLGNKLLVYISCCLAGRGYPLGHIPDELLTKVKTEVFQCVTKLRGSKSDTTVYPYLKTLLHFDTREFLNVLAIAFEEDEFKTESGMAMKQRLVDILLQIMVVSEGFSPSAVGALFTFLARQMAKRDDSIIVNRMLFEQVLEYLTNPDDETRKEERQQALMELLQAGAGLLEVNEERLMGLAEKAKFYRVCEYLYEKHHQYDKILTCYLQDPARKLQVFYYVDRCLGGDELNSKEKTAIEIQVLESIEELVEIDNRQTAQILIDFFPKNLNDFADALANNQTLLYQLLQGIFGHQSRSRSAGGGDNNSRTGSASPGYNDAQLQQTYIELMCQYDPDKVADFISTSDGYRLQETLEICEKYKIRDGMMYLLEKAGNIHGAFEMIHEDLQLTLKDVAIQIENSSSTKSKAEVDESHELNLWKRVNEKLTAAIELCQRNTGRMDIAERESLWFPLLEAVLEPQVHFRVNESSEHYLEKFKEMTRKLLNNMMGYVALPSVLQKMMTNPAFSSGKLGEIREMIMAMLETYNYEKTLLDTVANLLQSDVYNQLNQLCHVANKGVPCHGVHCSLCRKLLISDGSQVVAFQCGHGFHTTCLDGAKKPSAAATLDVTGTTTATPRNYYCYKCQSIGRRMFENKFFEHRIAQHSEHILQQQTTAASDRPSSKPPSSTTSGGGGSKSLKTGLDAQQIHALDLLLKNQGNPSRLLILQELLATRNDDPKRHPQKGHGGGGGRLRQASVLSREDFQLRLSPSKRLQSVCKNSEF